LGLGFFKNGPHGNKSLFALWGVVLGVDRLNSGPCLCFLWCVCFVFHFQLLCRVAFERRNVRRRILVLRTAKGEQVNLLLLLFLCFRSVVPFLSSVFQHCVFRWQSAVDTCGDALHLFSGCVKVFFLFFEVDGAVALVQAARAKLKYDSQDVWACVACCCCVLVGEKHCLTGFSYFCLTGNVQRKVC
jgi:hypothetical protein